MSDERQEIRVDHFTDTPENTFRTIGMLSPQELEAARNASDENFAKVRAARLKAEAEDDQQGAEAGKSGKKPTVWEMVKTAVNDLGGSTTNKAVREWVHIQDLSKAKASP